MRAFLVIIFSISLFTGFSQNFVSPGIIAFHSGAFERTIQDMNKAFETNSDMNEDMRSKAHYYRGMAKLNLLKAGSRASTIGNDPYLSVYNDLTRAVALDAKWKESTDPEMTLIYRQLIISATSNYNLGIKVNTEIEVNSQMEPAIQKLEAALKIRNSHEANELLGEVYNGIGTYYDQLYEDQNAQAKAIAAYQSAIKYHEAALSLNPRSLKSIKALKYFAYRLGNRDDELKYAQMEADIGG